jgi:hypothetical protein
MSPLGSLSCIKHEKQAEQQQQSPKLGLFNRKTAAQ